jgi:hypothetical protein
MPSNSSAFAIAVSGTDVYMGGDFDQAGDIAAKNIAHWDAAAHRWSALGAGVNNRVYAIAVHGNDVYVGGGFTQAGDVSVTSVAHWNQAAQTWSAMGGELTNGAYSPDVRAIAVADNGDVYAGGSFTKIGDLTVNNIARWDGTSWHALSTGTAGTIPDVDALAVSGSDVYAGGDFTSAGSNGACKQVCHWNGSAWSGLGGGTGGFFATVNAIALSGTNVYIGGEFDKVIDSDYSTEHPVGHVAMWNGSSWNTMGGGVGSPDVSALAVTPGGVYVGGRFTDLADGTTTMNRLARWTGSGWESLSTGSGLSSSNGVDSNLYSLAYSSAENSIYLGGFFSTAGSRTVNHAGRWSITDGDFYGLGNSVDGPITAMEQVGNKIFMAGNFNSAGGIPVTGLAAWDRSTHTWSALGTGISGCTGSLFGCTPQAYALKRSGDLLLVGGNFTNAGGNPVSRIAIWNPSTSTWLATSMTALSCTSSILIPCSSEVWAFETNGGYGIVAGGYFDKAGGTTVNNIARWTSAWNAFGSGVSGGTVKTIYYKTGGTGSTLYIGGTFSSPTKFAIWSGSSWSAASSSPSDQVNSIRGFDSDHVIVGGNFAQVGTDAYDHVALYDTATGGWSAAGSGLNGPVNSLFSNGSQVIAAGDFTASGITGMNRVAVYSGGAWSGLGSGADKPVQAVLYDGHSVYIAGSFLNAGAKPSAYFGRWSPPYEMYLPAIVH